MGDNKQHYHNKGQGDSSTRDYQPPPKLGSIEKKIEETDAYDEGYFGAKAQADVANGSYNPPSAEYSAAREAYDKAWEANKK